MGPDDVGSVGVSGGPRLRTASLSGDWLSYVRAMEFLGVSRSTLDCWRKSGHLTFSKLPNGKLRIRQSDLDAWLESLAEV